MSPEEFDNRLRSTFKDEYLPPREHLWQNINERLETAQGSSTLWYWLAPALILVVSGLAWLTSSIVNNSNDDLAVTTQNAPVINSQAAPSAPDAATKPYAPNEDAASNKPESSSTDIQTNKIEIERSSGIQNNADISQVIQDNSSNNSSDLNSALNSSNRTRPALNNRDNPMLDALRNQAANDARIKENAIADELEKSLLGYSKIRAFKKFIYTISPFTIDHVKYSAIPPKTIGNSASKPIKNTKVLEAGNFEANRHWINFGIGAITAYNSFAGYMDPTHTVHKDLWSNREKLTNNGAGFNTFLTYQNKFGMKNRLSYEVGFSYTSRSEDIKMNEYSKDVAYRDNDTIVQYQRFKLWTVMPGGDTNRFDLETPFILVAKNRYSVFTVPFRINYEQPISEHTFLSLGFGGGLSYIYTKKATHLDLVKETENTIYKKGQFMSSINGMMSFYTNFNSLGQLGVYCGYQMHIGSFKLNEQYGIKMSDLQYGLTFRRPLFVNKS